MTMCRVYAWATVLGLLGTYISNGAASAAVPEATSAAAWLRLKSIPVLTTPENRDKLVGTMRFSPNGRLLAYGHGGVIAVIDETGATILTLRDSDNAIGNPFFSSDGQTILAISRHRLHLFEVMKGRQLGSIELPSEAEKSGVGFNRQLKDDTLVRDLLKKTGDGSQVLLAYGDKGGDVHALYGNGMIKKLFRSPGKELSHVIEKYWIGVHVHGDLILAGDAEGVMTEYHVAAGKTRELPRMVAEKRPCRIRYLTVSPDGTMAAAAAWHFVRVMKTNDKGGLETVKGIVTGKHSSGCVAFTHDSQYLVISEARDGKRAIYDRDSKLIASFGNAVKPFDSRAFVLHPAGYIFAEAKVEKNAAGVLVAGNVVFEDLSTYFPKIPTSTRVGSR